MTIPGLQHPHRRASVAAVGRTEAAHRDRARARAQPARAAAGRGHVRARHAQREGELL